MNFIIIFYKPKGQTGYPWIDACMNQLRQEGWIHHVGRHAVSCFLTRGDLWIDWQDGLRVCKLLYYLYFLFIKESKFALLTEEESTITYHMY